MDVHLEQRELLKTLNERARGDLRSFWPAISANKNVDAARDELIDLLPTIGDTYGDAAGLLAVSYYDELRTRAGAPGDFDPILVDAPGDERWVALAKWGTQPLMDDPGDPANWAVSMEKISGGLQRSIADQHRKTITGTAVADPRARGWSRVGVGDSCEFCEMLLTRGAVYTDETAVFRSHDRCNCSAAPRFSNLPPPPRISPVDLSAKPSNTFAGSASPDEGGMPFDLDVAQTRKEALKRLDSYQSDNALRQIMEFQDLSDEALKRHFTKGATKIYRDHAPKAREALTGAESRTAVWVPEDALDAILQEGRFRNFHETLSSAVGDSAHAQYAANRTAVEGLFLGVPADAPLAARPVYGYRVDSLNTLRTRPSPFGGDIGDINVVLKSQVDDRSTITLGDSLNKPGLVPKKVDDLRASTDEAFADWARDAKDGFHTVPRKGKANYTDLLNSKYNEVQVYGGVGADDIERIVVDYSPYKHRLSPWASPEEAAELQAGLDRLTSIVERAKALGHTVEEIGRP